MSNNLFKRKITAKTPPIKYTKLHSPSTRHSIWIPIQGTHKSLCDLLVFRLYLPTKIHSLSQTTTSSSAAFPSIFLAVLKTPYSDAQKNACLSHNSMLPTASYPTSSWCRQLSLWLIDWFLSGNVQAPICLRSYFKSLQFSKLKPRFLNKLIRTFKMWK